VEGHGRTYVLDALTQHHLVEDFSSSHADKRVVHLGCAVRLQWRDIVVFAIERRRRSSPWRCLRGCSGGALCSPDIFPDDFCGGGLSRSLEGRDGGSLGATRKVARALDRLDGACACLLHCGEAIVRPAGLLDTSESGEGEYDREKTWEKGKSAGVCLFVGRPL